MLEALQDTFQQETSPAEPVVNLKEINNSDGNIVVLGVNHTTEVSAIAEASDSFVRFLNEHNPNSTVVLVEGGLVERARQIIQEAGGDISDETAIQYGDQTYFAIKALIQGFEVDTWDLSFSEQITKTVEKFGKEDSLLWFLAQALVFCDLKQPSIDQLLAIIKDFTGISAEEIKEWFDPYLSDLQKLDELLQNRGLPEWNELSISEKRRQFTLITNPEMGELVDQIPESIRTAASIPSAMGKVRDELALGKMQTLRDQGKAVLATCGMMHAEDWKTNPLFSGNGEQV